MSLALESFTQVAKSVMGFEVEALVGPKHQPNQQRDKSRWGNQAGYCVVGGQKVPLVRPRVRDVRQREVPLGSYQLLQKASLMEDAVWNKIMHGLSTRGYSEVLREIEQAYGIEKTTVSEHFIDASRRRLEKLAGRALADHAFCAMLIDGTFFAGQEVLTALGITLQGQKMVLGLRQGASENTTVVKQMLEDIAARGVDFEAPRLYVLDGSKALQSAVLKLTGKAALIQRCQVHKLRNVTDHLTEEHRMNVSCQMRTAYATQDYDTAKRALDRLLRTLMDLNPSAARSLEEGMEQTLTVHRLRLPSKLRPHFATTNMIESAFSIVETVCRNVKRWQGGDQHLRWIASGLLWSESRWNRLHGYRELPILIKEMELALVKSLPTRHRSVA
jgi:transposase-like protein